MLKIDFLNSHHNGKVTPGQVNPHFVAISADLLLGSGKNMSEVKYKHKSWVAKFYFSPVCFFYFCIVIVSLNLYKFNFLLIQNWWVT